MNKLNSRSIVVLFALGWFVWAAPSRSEAGEHPVEKLSWSFLNFTTPEYGWDRYRETFIGIPATKPVSLSSGFDVIFYEALYKKAISGSGNCFGLALMSALMNEKGAHLGYCAPVGQYPGDWGVDKGSYWASNSVPGGGGPKNLGLLRAIEETHGHQLNLRSLKHFVQNAKGHTPNQVFEEVKTQTDQGKLSLVSMTQGMGTGHTVLAYATVDVSENQKTHRRILIYDPNRNWANPADSQRGWYTGYTDAMNFVHPPENFITTVKEDNTWSFVMAGPSNWSGPGGPLDFKFLTVFPIPLAAPRDRNPASLGFGASQLLKEIVVSGSGASLVQVTDGRGKLLFEPGTRRIESNPITGLLNTAPFIPSDGPAAGAPTIETFFMFDGSVDPLDLEVRGGATGYELYVAGQASALRVEAPGAAGTDLVRVSGVGTAAPAVLLFNPLGVESYNVDLVLVVEPGKDVRFFKLRDIALPQDSVLDLSLSRDGRTLKAVSPFQDVRFDLQIVRQGPEGEESLDVPGVEIEAGRREEIRPRDWSDIDASPPYLAKSIEPSGSIERYATVIFGAPGGPVGPDFDAARDIGRSLPGAPVGSTTYDPRTGLYTQISSGEEIGDSGDSFQFAYQAIRGDFELTVEILERRSPLVPAARFGRHGLMARRDATPASRFCQIQTNTGGDAIEWPRWAYRASHGDPNAAVEEHAFNYPPDQWPRFMKLVRRGKTFHGFLSRDGRAWDPVGSDIWLDQSPRSPVLVGFASTSHRSAQGQPSRFRFRVVQIGPIESALPPPLHDDGLATGRVIHDSSFDGPDGTEPVGFSAQKREGSFTPAVAGGRLRMTSELAARSATSAFLRQPLLAVDERVQQFDFDLFITRRDGSMPSGGVAFCMSAGTDAGRVGLSGPALGYFGLGREVETSENVSTNDLAVAFALDPSAPSPGGAERYRLSVLSQGSLAPVAEALRPLSEILDPQGLHVRVFYNAGKVSVFVGPNAAAGGALAKALDAQTLPLSFLREDGAAVAGFTASTGAEAATAEVDAFQIAGIDCDDIPEVAEVLGVPVEPAPAGTRVTLDGSGSSGGIGDQDEPVSYLWAVLSGSAHIVGPAHGPTVNLAIDGAGEVRVRLSVDDGQCQNPASKVVEFKAAGEAANRIRCDCNGDGGRDLTDAIVVLSYLFLGGNVSCPAACNCNGDLDGDRPVIDISDAIFDLNYQFLGGASPPPPYPACEPFAGCESLCP